MKALGCWLALVVLIVPELSIANDCMVKEFMERTVLSQAVSADYRFSSYVSEDQWRNASRNASASTRYKGVPLGGTYDEYRTTGASKIRQSGSEISENQFISYVTETINLEAYKWCLQASRSGVFLYKSLETPNEVSIVVSYNDEYGPKEVSLQWNMSPPLRDVVTPVERIGKNRVVSAGVVSKPESGSYVVQITSSNYRVDQSLLVAAPISAVPELPPLEPDELIGVYPDIYVPSGCPSPESIPPVFRFEVSEGQLIAINECGEQSKVRILSNDVVQYSDWLENGRSLNGTVMRFSNGRVRAIYADNSMGHWVKRNM